MAKMDQLKKSPKLSENDRKTLLVYANSLFDTTVKSTLQSTVNKNPIKFS